MGLPRTIARRLERNLKFLADRGVDYIRVLGVVGPRGWADRTVSAADPQLESTWAGVTDLAYDVYGLRVQWTIFGGLDETPTPADRAKVVDRFVAAMQRRAHKVQHVEVANEGYATGWAELRDEAKQLATRIREQTPFRGGRFGARRHRRRRVVVRRLVRQSAHRPSAARRGRGRQHRDMALRAADVGPVAGVAPGVDEQ